MCKICIFAGASEGRALVERLCGRGAQITACVATEYGETLLQGGSDLRVHSGRLDQAQMEAMFAAEGFDLVIDATHPYAEIVSENIAAACQNTHIDLLHLLRSSESAAEDGVFVENTAACVEYLKSTQGNILLTTGSKELAAYACLGDRLYVRVLPMQASLEACAASGVAQDHILAMQGPFDEDMNLAMLKMAQARILVTKDTGGPGGYGAKIRAAHRAGAQAVIVGRPAQRGGMDLEAMLHRIERQFNLPPARKKLTLIGFGMGDMETRTLGMERALREADCLIGARRMLESVSGGKQNRHVAVLAREIADYIRQSQFSNYAALFSGDTGFYSGAKALLNELADMPNLDIDVLTGIGSLQYFCARLRRPWEDVRPVSLHGRDCDFVREVRFNPAVFALVGGEDGVLRALDRLQRAGLGSLHAHVGQRLAYPEEQISHGTVDELRHGNYDSLSVLLVENPRWKDCIVTHGLPDEAFDRDETPMTKAEVRAITLSKLQLTQGAIVYDVGSGSGSVSVECALQARHGRVYAIEMKEKALALTRRNAEKFQLNNLEIIRGRAPEALEDLPAPSHAFIGGSTGHMREILDCLRRKNPSVRIVVNTVTLETLAELTEIAKEFDYSDIAEISVSKPRTLGNYQLMTAQNPVFVFTLQNGAQA